MRNICIVCEGTTETEFVNKCLVPHLIQHNVYSHARILQAPSGNHRGGRVTVERLAKHMAHEYSSYDRMTTLVDFYGFKNRNGRGKSEIESAILTALKASNVNIDERFVMPYVQMHEFEGLLFSEVKHFNRVIDGWSEQVHQNLLFVREKFGNPEEINDSPQTAPSKRLGQIFPNGSYSKTEHGPLIAESIGLGVIRQNCPLFHEWLSHLENWG